MAKRLAAVNLVSNRERKNQNAGQHATGTIPGEWGKGCVAGTKAGTQGN